jgi:hypothetical protein
MKNKVSFEGIGEVVATFYAGEGVKAGQVVKIGGDSSVAPCAAGECFCGVATSVKAGCAGVQVEGFAAVSCGDSSVTVGKVALAADGNGGVKKTAGGQEYWVVADDGAGTITIKM